MCFDIRSDNKGSSLPPFPYSHLVRVIGPWWFYIFPTVDPKDTNFSDSPSANAFAGVNARMRRGSYIKVMGGPPPTRPSFYSVLLRNNLKADDLVSSGPPRPPGTYSFICRSPPTDRRVSK